MSTLSPPVIIQASDLKQQLKHTDIQNLCMASSADKAAAAHARGGSSVGVAGIVQDFQNMAAFGGLGVKGRVQAMVQAMVASVRAAVRGRRGGRANMRYEPPLRCVVCHLTRAK